MRSLVLTIMLLAEASLATVQPLALELTRDGDALEVEVAFTDVHEIGASCRYPTCTHRMEPECSVMEAVKEGTLSPERYESYARLVDETELQKEEDRVRRDSEGSPERALRRSEDRDRELVRDE